MAHGIQTKLNAETLIGGRATNHLLLAFWGSFGIARRALQDPYAAHWPICALHWLPDHLFAAPILISCHMRVHKKDHLHGSAVNNEITWASCIRTAKYAPDKNLCALVCEPAIGRYMRPAPAKSATLIQEATVSMWWMLSVGPVSA